MRAAARHSLRQRFRSTPAMAAFSNVLAPIFDGRQADITEENIQSRSRGLILMAISNKLGHMVLTTGNKSEMSVGYATLYGDMCGGYSVLKDVYKTTVFALARWRNANRAARRARAGRARHARAHHHQAAERRTEAEPDRPGHAAAVRGAGRHPGRAGRGRAAASMSWWRRASIARPCCACGRCWTAPNTSAGRRRRG